MTSKPTVWLTVIILGGLSYGGWTFWSSLSTQKPQYQKIVDQSGVPLHYVEVWVQPTPPQTGEATTITVRINYQMLRGGTVDELSMRLQHSGSSNILRPNVHFRNEPNGRGELYVARVQFPDAGRWQLSVTTNIRGTTTRTTFPLSVRSGS